MRTSNAEDRSNSRHMCRRLSCRGLTPAPHIPHRWCALLPHFNHARCCASEDLRLVHLLRASRRRPECPRRGRADDVAELVASFAEPCREELYPVVVTLDVIESAAPPPGCPVVAGLALIVLSGSQRC